MLIFTMMAMAALVLVMEFALVDTVRMQKKGRTRTKYKFRAEKLHYQKSILPEVFPERSAKPVEPGAKPSARQDLKALKAHYDSNPSRALQGLCAQASEQTTMKLWSLLQHEQRVAERKAIVDALSSCAHPSAEVVLINLANESDKSEIREHARACLSKSASIDR